MILTNNDYTHNNDNDKNCYIVGHMVDMAEHRWDISKIWSIGLKDGENF
jgi:hypothetical protein